jgi:hypothetical protein
MELPKRGKVRRRQTNHSPFSIRFHQLFYRNASLVHLCTWMAGQKGVKLEGWLLKERWIDDRHRHMSNKPWK